MLDGGAPFYDTYETADGKYVAIGAIETRFWADAARPARPHDARVGEPQPIRRTGRALREQIAAAVATRTRDEWAALAEGTDACLTPVLSLSEAPAHPHNVARATFRRRGRHQRSPRPRPKFSRTQPDAPTPPVEPRSDTDAVLGELGLAEERIAQLRATGVVA